MYVAACNGKNTWVVCIDRLSLQLWCPPSSRWSWSNFSFPTYSQYDSTEPISTRTTCKPRRVCSDLDACQAAAAIATCHLPNDCRCGAAPPSFCTGLRARCAICTGCASTPPCRVPDLVVNAPNTSRAQRRTYAAAPETAAPRADANGNDGMSGGRVGSMSPDVLAMFNEAQKNIMELNRSRLKALEELKEAKQRINDLGKRSERTHTPRASPFTLRRGAT